MKIRDFGEFPFLRRLRNRLPADPRVQLGLGDDCAALALSETTLLTTDALIEGVHFRREWTTFSILGEKAFAVNASDIVAMGGEPTFALLSLGVPSEDTVDDLEGFFDGFLRATKECGAALIGGNMSAAPCLMLSVTLLGRAPHGIVTRAGARVGDDLYVTGTLGDAALGLRLLHEGRDDRVAQSVQARFLCPTVRFAVGREVATRRLATAMIDISDGLFQDLSHLCEESHVGAVVEASALPLSVESQTLLGAGDWSVALTGGEDYELLFAVSPQRRLSVEAVAQTTGCRLTRIGSIVSPTDGIVVRGPGGEPYTPVQAGYDHFRQG